MSLSQNNIAIQLLQHMKTWIY